MAQGLLAGHAMCGSLNTMEKQRRKGTALYPAIFIIEEMACPSKPNYFSVEPQQNTVFRDVLYPEQGIKEDLFLQNALLQYSYCNHSWFRRNSTSNQ